MVGARGRHARQRELCTPAQWPELSATQLHNPAVIRLQRNARVRPKVDADHEEATLLKRLKS